MEEVSVENKQVSKINSGMLLIQRLDSLWKDSHRHSRDGDYKSWNEDLDRIWMELGGDVEKDGDEEKEYEKFIKEYANSIDERKTSGFQTLSKEEKLSLIKQKVILQRKELFLRRLMNKQGKGTAYEDDEGFD